ncbi:MAG TPA: lysylphosphatidylglycerol synthase transmembrane domain-containing protein [Gaiellaceae bacterium]|nr:lysylphosphatidylglycerol synthase transmembrane domain-containing protein [Gaiellaceae bacterium]
MRHLLDSIEVFYDHISAVDFRWIAVALFLHFLRSLAISRAWRNVIKEAYPDEKVRWRTIWGAYLAGVGVNALIPARAGDAVRLYLVKHRVDNSTYTTLASSLGVMAIFDITAALALFVFALTQGVLPNIHVVPNLPSLDFGWLLQHTRLSIAVAVVMVIALVVGYFWAARHVRAFKERVAQGFAVLREPRRYLRRVALWQAVDWTTRIAETFFFLKAFHIVATVHNALIAQVAQSASTALPITPGGIGTEQALLVVVLAGAASKTALVAFSVGVKITVTAANVVVGFLALLIMARTIDFREIKRRRQAEEAAASAVPPG